VPILITLAALGTVGIARQFDRFFKSQVNPSAVVPVALVLFAFFSVFFAPEFAYWDNKSGGIAMVDQLSRDPSVCGLGVHGISWFDTGGYTHLHRNIPMVLMSDGPQMEQESSSVNAVIAYGRPPRLSPDFALKTCSDGVCLYQRPGTCQSPQTDEVNAILRQSGN
jgi:hypothetical protein